MIRKIIKIEEDKCNGCGLCANACHEGAIAIVNGKAKLIRDDYCDGLGNCLPVCPTGAITFEEREALEYDEKAVEENMKKRANEKSSFSGCPSSRAAVIKESPVTSPAVSASTSEKSMLTQWPVQLQLVPVNAPYFDGAKLLVAADCTAYAYAAFHRDFIAGHITLIGCPKLDASDYAEKLAAIIKNNDIKELTIVKMEVPCCSGLEHAAIEALRRSGKIIPWKTVTVSIDGKIKKD